MIFEATFLLPKTQATFCLDQVFYKYLLSQAFEHVGLLFKLSTIRIAIAEIFLYGEMIKGQNNI